MICISVNIDITKKPFQIKVSPNHFTLHIPLFIKAIQFSGLTHLYFLNRKLNTYIFAFFDHIYKFYKHTCHLCCPFKDIWHFSEMLLFEVTKNILCTKNKFENFDIQNILSEFFFGNTKYFMSIKTASFYFFKFWIFFQLIANVEFFQNVVTTRVITTTGLSGLLR